MNQIRILELERQDLRKEFEKIRVDRKAITIMLPKGKFYALKLENLKSAAANIIKQEMLSKGGEAALARGAIDGRIKNSDCIILGTEAQYNNLVKKLALQPWGLKEISDNIKKTLQNYTKRQKLISWDGYRLKLGQKTLIMGILNVTPDSFSDGGRFFTLDSAVKQAQKLDNEGADIIDIGGESTRPGAKPVSLKEELQRVIPVIEQVRKRVKIPLSIDTRHSKVAEEAIKCGANIINDVTGLNSPSMVKVACKYNVPVVIMHMKGTPRNMQRNPHYEDLISEIYSFFAKRIQKLVGEGLKEDKIIIDPGIGFGKSLEHNLQIFKRLGEFKSLGRPLLIGPSRKSFIGMILKLPVDKRLNGTLASSALAIINGADILRVHDVKEVSELAKVIDKIMR